MTCKWSDKDNSASPRRRELLSRIGLEFTVMPIDIEEKPQSILPADMVIELSKQKARDITKNVILWKTEMAAEMEFFCPTKTVDFVRHFAYNKDKQVAILAGRQREVPLI